MASPGRPQDVWKASAAARPPGPARARAPGRGRWFGAALAVVALGGAIAGLLVYLWPDPEPVVLAVPVAAYDHDDWPPNPWAESDARGLVGHFRDGGAQTFQAQDRTAVLRELDRAAGDAKKRPLVVYLSALGLAADGRVQLLPGGATPDDPGTWLALDEVLTRVRRANAPRLLVLDVRPAAELRAVVTAADVNELLDATLAQLSERGELPYLVLTANTPPDGANALRAFKKTAFGLALAHGAGGAADGWNPDRKRDGRVSARELSAYARELTHHASTAAGLPAQTPRLHGTGGDFDLFTVPRDGPAVLPAPGDPEPVPPFLADAWKDRDDWTRDEVHLRAPRVVRQLALAAARAERLWLGGREADAVRARFDVPAKRLRDLRPSLAPLARPVTSVARAEQKLPANAAAVAAALAPVLNRLHEPPGPERDKTLPAAMKEVWAKPPEAEPFDAVALAVSGFARNIEKPTHDQMKQLAALLAGFKPRPPRHAELQAIALVGGLAPDLMERWPPGAIAVVRDVARAAEEAAAVDGRCLPWFQATVEKADESRRQALRDLCDPKKPYAAREAAVRTLEAAGKTYGDVRAAAGALASAFREYEETRAVLVDLAVAYPYDHLPRPEDLASAWDRLAEDFGRLGTLLRAPAARALPDPGELERAAQAVRSGRDGLHRALVMTEPEGVRPLERMLAWPHWSRDERLRLTGRLAEADRAAARKVLDTWPKDPPGRDTPTPPPTGGRLASAALGDLRRTVAVLRLADAPGAAELKADLDRLGANPAPAAVAEIARKVRAAGRRGLADAYAAADAGRQAATGWAVDPDDVPAFPREPANAPPNPEPAARRAAERAFHDWLRQRYTAEAAFLGGIDTPAAREAANACRELARACGEAFR